MRERRRRFAWILGLALCLIAPAAPGQDEVTVKAILEEEQVPVGVPTFLKIQVDGGDPPFPQELEAEGLKIDYYFARPKLMIINGTQYSRVTAYYTVTGSKVGTFQIPPYTCSIEGKDYATEPLTIEVIEMQTEANKLDSSEPQFLHFNAGKLDAYVSEMIPVECNLYVRGSNSVKRVNFPKFESSDKFVIRPFPTKYTHKIEYIDDIPYTLVRFPTTIAALSPGEHEIGPALVTASVMSPINPGISRSPLIQISQPKTVTSNTLKFNVRPLPVQGRPPQFEGAVGRFDIQTQATPVELKVGDPISLEIQVSGVGNFDSLSLPSIEEGKGWKVYPSTRIEEEGRSEFDQSVRFTQVVIPMEQHAQLPAIELAFFDPAEEKYSVVSSSPIPLKIAADPMAMSAAGAANLAQMGLRGEQLNDILFIHTGSAKWLSPNGSILDRPAFWIMQILPALGLLGILMLAWRQWQREAAAQRAAKKYPTPGELRSRLGHERMPRNAFYSLLLECFERTRAERGDLLQKLNQQARAAWDRLSRQGNAILYSGAEGANSPVSREERQDAIVTLKELEALTESA